MDHVATDIEVSPVESLTSVAEDVDCVDGSGSERCGMRGGLSERDFVSRQRYLENSGLPGAVSYTVSVAAQPIEPKVSSSHELHTFIQEQRKIILKFRAQPWPMQVKLAALKSYKSNLTKYVNYLNTIDTFRDSSGLVFSKAKKMWRATKERLTVWNTIIKRIEGNFGTSVASFFTFLRWLCSLNFFLTLLVFAFIVLPQLVAGTGLAVPSSVRGNSSAVSILIDGEGYAFEYSVLFYGYYDSGQGEPYSSPPANPHPFIGLNYKLPLAYLLLILCLFVICGAAILSNIAKKFKLLERANLRSDYYLFTWKVFAGWDFAITSSKLAAAKKRQMGINFKETIEEVKKSEEGGINWCYWVIRILTNSFLFLVLGGSGYAIYLAVENERRFSSSQNNIEIIASLRQGLSGIWQLIQTFQAQFVIVARNFLLRFFFLLAELMERFHPRTALKLLLLRMYVLYFSGLYILVISLYTLTTTCRGTAPCCWETTIGQELYKLTFTHLLVDLSSLFLLDGGRWALSKACCSQCSKFTNLYNKYIGAAEFQVANTVLQLVYAQALVLFGVLFCPLLVAIGFAKNILTFYVHAVVVYCFNKPPRTLFRIASTRNFYMGLLLVTVFMCALPVVYAMVELVPSTACGPFRGLPSMLSIVVNEIATWPVLLQTIAGYCQRATVIVPLIALLSIVIYYYIGHSNSLREVNKDLRLQLSVEQNENRERVKKEAVAETAGESVMMTDRTQRNRELQEALHNELNRKLKSHNHDQQTTSASTHGMDLSWLESQDALRRQRTRRLSTRHRPELPWDITHSNSTTH